MPGRLPHERASAIEEAIWEKMHFARHLREERLGEFTIGTDLHRSDSLAVVQLLILYHMVTARAVVSLGGTSTREFDVSTLDELIAEGGHSPLRGLMPLALTGRVGRPARRGRAAVLAVVVVYFVWRWAKRSERRAGRGATPVRRAADSWRARDRGR